MDRRLTDTARAQQYILDRTVVEQYSGCWVWQLRTQKGYGKMGYAGADWYAHRFAYHHFVEPLPRGTVVHHMCTNRPCCNPEHLQVVSHSENAAEMLGRVFYEEEIAHLREEIEALQKALKERENIAEQTEYE